MKNFLINFILKTSLITFIFVFIFANNSWAQPLPAKLYTNTLDAKVGDTILLRLKVDPRTGQPVYTVSASLMYDPTLLKYDSADFADSVKMLPVPKPPYTLTDTENGMIRRTAGYPNGTDSLVDFTTYKFEAINPGDAVISIEDGVALDENNTDIGLQQKQLTIHITEPSDDEVSTSTEQTVDMNLGILGPIAIYKENDYNFEVLNAENRIPSGSLIRISAYNDKTELFYLDEIEYDASSTAPYLTFTIPGGTFDVGNYMINIESVDQDGKTTMLAQKYVGVLSNGETWFTKYRNIWVPLFIFIIAFAAIHHYAREREIYSLIPGFIGTRKNKKMEVKKTRKRTKNVDN